MPDLVRGLRSEIALKPVGRNGIAVAAVGGARPARQGGQSAYASPAYQAFDPGAPNRATSSAQNRMDPWCAITATANDCSIAGMDQPDVLKQCMVGLSTRAFRPLPPRITAAG